MGRVDRVKMWGDALKKAMRGPPRPFTAPHVVCRNLTAEQLGSLIKVAEDSGFLVVVSLEDYQKGTRGVG